MRSSMTVAAAVAAALGTAVSGAALAAPPSLSQAAAAPVTLYIAGSSAAKPAIVGAIQNNLCGGAGNALTLTSGNNNTNFVAVSCTVAASTGLSFAGQIATVYYRLEGGSVVGALPIVTGAAINTLNLNDTANIPSCASGATSCTPTVTGSSAANGISDTFTGAVTKHTVQLGITDLEPGVFFSDNYPSAYQSSVYGKATAAQMAGLNNSAVTLFDQVFGVFVNTNSSVFTAAEKASLSISKSTLTNLLQGNISDWSKAQDVNGNAIASGTLAVGITNREAGSGSRASAAIYFTGDECSPSAVTIADPAGATGDFFSTGDVLTRANSVAGAITYASIDNFNATKFPNLTLVSINGIAPSNVAAANGQYDYWYEATAIKNPSLSGNSGALADFIIGAVQTESTAPHLVDVLAIPGNSTNVAALPVSSTANGSPAIYVNPYTRVGISCNSPISAL